MHVFVVMNHDLCCHLSLMQLYCIHVHLCNNKRYYGKAYMFVIGIEVQRDLDHLEKGLKARISRLKNVLVLITLILSVYVPKP